MQSVDDCTPHLEQRITKSRSLSKMSISSAGSSNYHFHREPSYSLEDSEDDDESEMHIIYSPAPHREHSPDEVPPQVQIKKSWQNLWKLWLVKLIKLHFIASFKQFMLKIHLVSLDYWAQRAYVSNRDTSEPLGAETHLVGNWGISRASKFEGDLHNQQVIIFEWKAVYTLLYTSLGVCFGHFCCYFWKKFLMLSRTCISLIKKNCIVVKYYSVSPMKTPEIIIKCYFVVQYQFLIINVEKSCAAVFFQDS